MATSSWLSEAALKQIPEADSISISAGHSIPLAATGSRTTTTARQARLKGLAYDSRYADNFQVGMDINLIIHELHQNTLRHLCIADTDRSRLFADPEIQVLSAAIKDNTSVITLRIPGCHATDKSLLLLYAALANHPSIRSLDVSDTKGSEQAGKALVALVCKNTQIAHVDHANIRISDKDEDMLQEALAMNCFSCQDPGKNPYDASLIRYIDQAGRAEREAKDQVTIANPWMVDPETGDVQLHVLENIARLYAPAADPEGAEEEGQETEKKKRRKKKGVAFGVEKEYEVHRQVCDDYMNGVCRYGSRCKYLHPEKTSALQNRIIAAKARDEEERLEDEEYKTNNDDRTTVASRTSTKKLRGRTKSTFRFDVRKVKKATAALAQDDTHSDCPAPRTGRNTSRFTLTNTALIVGSVITISAVIGLKILQ